MLGLPHLDSSDELDPGASELVTDCLARRGAERIHGALPRP